MSLVEWLIFFNLASVSIGYLIGVNIRRERKWDKPKLTSDEIRKHSEWNQYLSTGDLPSFDEPQVQKKKKPMNADANAMKKDFEREKNAKRN